MCICRSQVCFGGLRSQLEYDRDFNSNKLCGSSSDQLTVALRYLRADMEPVEGVTGVSTVEVISLARSRAEKPDGVVDAMEVSNISLVRRDCHPEGDPRALHEDDGDRSSSIDDPDIGVISNAEEYPLDERIRGIMTEMRLDFRAR